jgi:AhpD family alkylhydroperoxidase
MSSALEDFNDYRSRMNDRIMDADNLVLKRLFNLDSNTYADGALPVKTKEMLGLVASMVLRCDDCIKYHLIKCHENGVSKTEVFEVCHSQYCWRHHCDSTLTQGG